MQARRHQKYLSQDILRIDNFTARAAQLFFLRSVPVICCYFCDFICRVCLNFIVDGGVST